MEILFLSQIVPYPPHGGVLQRGYNIIREICKYNDVHLLAFVHPEYLGTPELIRESREHLLMYCDSVNYFSLWPKRSKIHKMAAFSLGFFYPKPFSILAHKSASFGACVSKMISEESIDIIHFDTIGLTRYLPPSADVATVLTHHNIESTLMARRARVESNWFTKFYAGLQATRLKSYEISQISRFDVNIMMSKIDESELLGMAPAVQTEIVPNGVDTEYFTIRPDPQEMAIIYTGGMNMFANKDAVLHLIKDIWPKIKEQLPETVFYVVGQDPPVELMKISERDSGIKVMGFVDDIRPYVAKAAVYVVPLRVGGGTRLKILDALAQGKAIVSTSVGCEGIEVTDGLNIHIEDTDQGFALRVIELLRDPQRRCEMGEEARKLVEEKNGWPAIGKVLQGAYELVMAQRRNG